MCGGVYCFNPGVGMFSFVGLCRPYIPCNSQEDFHHRGHIGHVVSCAFDASRFEMVIIFGVPISLTVCTMRNIPLVFGWFEFYFAH
jgi:hypothetical protein